MSVEWNWAGARWWKFDFQTHTPESDDYGKGPVQEKVKQCTPKEWLLYYIRAGIDCVAVTDHNTGAWIDRLKGALEELKTENNHDYRTFYLFPGVEITVNGGIHILAILIRDKGTADIDTLLGAVRFRGTKGKSNECTECSPVDCIKAIVDAGGIAIPAHVDHPHNGLFKLSGTSLKQVLGCEHILAMELWDQLFKKPQLYINKKLTWPEVPGSDAHNPDGLRSPGSHFTWIKMGDPNLGGLRLALLDGPLSIKRSDAVIGDPNKHGIWSSRTCRLMMLNILAWEKPSNAGSIHG